MVVVAPLSSDADAQPTSGPSVDRFAHSMRVQRAALWLTLVLYAGFGALDPWLAPAAVMRIWLIRGVVSVALLAGLYLLRDSPSPARVQAVLVSAVLFMGAGLTGIVLFAGATGGATYVVSFVPVVLFAHGLVRLRFLPATVSCWLVTLGYLGAAALAGGMPASALAGQIFLLGSANVMGMFASWQRDSSAHWANALARSEARLQLLVDSMNEGLVAVDDAGYVTWANRSACEMFRLDPARAAGRHPFEFLDAENRRVFEQQFSVRSGGLRQRYEIDWVRTDGSSFNSIVSPQPLFAGEGRFSGSVSVITDVTPLKEAERAVRRSEARVQAIFASAAVGFAVIDRGGRLVQVNEHLAALTGYTRAELRGRTYLDLIPPPDRPAIQHNIEGFFAGEVPLTREERCYLRKDGSTFVATVAPAPLRVDQDQVEAIVISLVDITALKQAREALEQSERHFRELVDYASSIILRWDVDGTIRFVNPFGLRFLGYARDEIVGRNVVGPIVPATDSSGRDLAAMIRDITIHPERYLFNENEIRDRNGRRYWVVWTNRALYGPDGRVAEVLSIGTDITELKQAREALAKQRDELAELNDFIRSVFGRYVSDAVMEDLLASPASLRVGGTKRAVSILVSDIRGFSTICEELSPEQVVALLNTYFETMTAVIERYDGTIDELLGDSLLVLFGAPVEAQDHAARALGCAVDMQLAMANVNARNASSGLPAIEMGIGIDTGNVVAGSIGCARRAKYGVVGSHVNLASRIESFTVGGQILVSDQARRGAGEGFVFGRRLEVQPKGAREPQLLHEVLGVRGADPSLSARPEPAGTPVDLDVTYRIVEEKHVCESTCRGRIVRLSRTSAEMTCSATPPLLTNLLLWIGGGPAGEAAGEIYAKVVDHAGAGPVTLRFTSVPPAARRFFAQVLAASPEEAAAHAAEPVSAS